MEPVSASSPAQLLLRLKCQQPILSLQSGPSNRISESKILNELAAFLRQQQRHAAVPDSHGPYPSDKHGLLFILSVLESKMTHSKIGTSNWTVTSQYESDIWFQQGLTTNLTAFASSECISIQRLTLFMLSPSFQRLQQTQIIATIISYRDLCWSQYPKNLNSNSLVAKARKLYPTKPS